MLYILRGSICLKRCKMVSLWHIRRFATAIHCRQWLFPPTDRYPNRSGGFDVTSGSGENARMALWNRREKRLKTEGCGVCTQTYPEYSGKRHAVYCGTERRKKSKDDGNTRWTDERESATEYVLKRSTEHWRQARA